MSNGARCHYCQKNPCGCLGKFAVIGHGMSGTTDDPQEAFVWLSNNPKAVLYERLSSRSTKELQMITERANLEYCDLCDGCGWYEGGKTIKTKCAKCQGTGVVSKEIQNIVRRK